MWQGLELNLTILRKQSKLVTEWRNKKLNSEIHSVFHKLYALRALCISKKRHVEPELGLYLPIWLKQG